MNQVLVQYTSKADIWYYKERGKKVVKTETNQSNEKLTLVPIMKSTLTKN